MMNMFLYAKAFTDQNLSSWDVSNASNKHDLFMHDSGGGNTEPKWK